MDTNEKIVIQSGVIVSNSDIKTLVEAISHLNRGISVSRPSVPAPVATSNIKTLAAKLVEGSLVQTGQETPKHSTLDLIPRFLTTRKGAGCQDSTIKSYGGVLRLFAAKFPVIPENAETISGHLASQRKDASRRYVFRILSLFYAFASEVLKVSNPMLKVAKPKIKREEKEWLTLDEARRLMEACKTDRERALIDCYMNLELRLSEALRLNVRDIGENLIHIQGKERNEAFPLLPEVRDLLLKISLGCKPKGPVFRNYRRKRLGLDTAERDVKDIFQRAGINKKRQSPHTLRHTFGAMAVQHGCNQYILKRLLRHATSSGDVTDSYSHITVDDLRKALETYSPVRLIKKLEKPAAEPEEDKLLVKLTCTRIPALTGAFEIDPSVFTRNFWIASSTKTPGFYRVYFRKLALKVLRGSDYPGSVRDWR